MNGDRDPVEKARKTLDLYCDRFAEPEVRFLERFPARMEFEHVIVVPAYREGPEFLTEFQGLAEATSRTLTVLVINQPDSDDHMGPGGALFTAAVGSGRQVWQAGQLTLVQWRNHSGVLVVDRFSPGLRIPSRQGVGLARKIGCDLAVALRRRKSLTARFIHTTDADATLPADYLLQTRELGSPSAAIYPFRHSAGEDPVGRATRLYEQSLHYYVEALQWAGSPYAFHTIGSCVALSCLHYCMARGFPKRAGGEDFYLLNKLAKLAPVACTRGSPIVLKARRSARVPFGTGPAVERILALPGLEDFRTYDPRIFVELRKLLERFPGLWEHKVRPENWLETLPPMVRDACTALGMENLFRHIGTQAENEAQCQRHIETWFDGFRTLKFIHYLQQHWYPPMKWADVSEQAQCLFR